MCAKMNSRSTLQFLSSFSFHSLTKDSQKCFRFLFFFYFVFCVWFFLLFRFFPIASNVKWRNSTIALKRFLLKCDGDNMSNTNAQYLHTRKCGKFFFSFCYWAYAIISFLNDSNKVSLLHAQCCCRCFMN